MAVDLQIKKDDERNWVFTLSDSSSSALNLTGTTVHFKLRHDEGDPIAYFTRVTGSGGTGSDFITIGTPASDGQVTITPTPSDWTAVSDDYGIYVGSFKVITAGGVNQYTKDVTVDIQEAII